MLWDQQWEEEEETDKKEKKKKRGAKEERKEQGREGGEGEKRGQKLNSAGLLDVKKRTRWRDVTAREETEQMNKQLPGVWV